MTRETELEMVQRHVAGGERIISLQLHLLRRMQWERFDKRLAEELLKQLEVSQALHLHHLARLRDEEGRPRLGERRPVGIRPTRRQALDA